MGVGRGPKGKPEKVSWNSKLLSKLKVKIRLLGNPRLWQVEPDFVPNIEYWKKILESKGVKVSVFVFYKDLNASINVLCEYL